MGNGGLRRHSAKKCGATLLNYSNEENMVGKNEETMTLALKVVQKQIIIDSWHNVDDKIEFVERVFERIFDKNPSLKTPFRLDQYSNTEEFRRHIVSFCDFLTSVVDKLNDDETKLLKSTEKLGRAHVKFVNSELFNEENINIFVTSLVDCFEHEQKTMGDEYHETKMTKKILETWTLFLTHLFAVMLKGYKETN